MKRRRKEGPGGQSLGTPVIDCPRCGLPCRPHDSKCAYCGSPLDKPAQHSLSERFFAWWRTARFRIGLAAERESVTRAAGKGGAALLSVCLLAGGLLLFYSGITGGGALKLFAGILLTLYGGAGLYQSLGRRLP